MPVVNQRYYNKHGTYVLLVFATHANTIAKLYHTMHRVNASWGSQVVVIFVHNPQL